MYPPFPSFKNYILQSFVVCTIPHISHAPLNGCFFVLLCFVFLLFRAALATYESSWLGVELELKPPAYTTATATEDPSCICSLHRSSHNARSLTHRARPGIKPTSLWIPVRFVSTELQWELPIQFIF